MVMWTSHSQHVFPSCSLPVSQRKCGWSSLCFIIFTQIIFFALPVLTFFQLIGLWGAESDDAMGDGVRPFPAACSSLWLLFLMLLNTIDSLFLLRIFVLPFLVIMWCRDFSWFCCVSFVFEHAASMPPLIFNLTKDGGCCVFVFSCVFLCCWIFWQSFSDEGVPSNKTTVKVSNPFILRCFFTRPMLPYSHHCVPRPKVLSLARVPTCIKHAFTNFCVRTSL